MLGCRVASYPAIAGDDPACTFKERRDDMPETRILLSCPQMEDLAAEIARRNADIKRGQIDWKRFPDGFPDLMVHDTERLARHHVSFLACFDDPRVIFEQWSMIRHVAKLGPKTFRILLPYFPTGTMERSDHEGQVATADSLSALLSKMPPAGPGPVPLYLWDIHALPNRFYFGDNIKPVFKTGLKQLFTEIEGRKNVTIVFPDEGAWKRFGKMEPFVAAKARLGFRVAVCRKVRDGDKRYVTLAEGRVRGRDAIVVDDLIHSGSTLIECGRMLLKKGARSVDAYVTHAVCENAGWKKFDGKVFKTLFLTNSCPATAKAVKGQPHFRVLSLCDSAANAIRQ
jgi:phosphoribosylpyrophosphate synthetase